MPNSPGGVQREDRGSGGAPGLYGGENLSMPDRRRRRARRYLNPQIAVDQFESVKPPVKFHPGNDLFGFAAIAAQFLRRSTRFEGATTATAQSCETHSRTFRTPTNAEPHSCSRAAISSRR